MFQHTAFGIVKAVAEHNAINVVVQNCLNVAAHVIAIRLPWLRADIKGCYTLVAMWRERGFYAFGMIFGLMERPAADWY